MSKSKLIKRIKAAAVGAAVTAAALVTPFVMPQMKTKAADYDNYAKLLQYSMYFYDANMCGDKVGENSAVEWRDDCHEGDSVPGGFHDAGDHVKFGLPAGYTASTLGWGYYEFKDSYDSLGQKAHLKTITDYFAKYFKDCTTLSGDTVTKFVYQVGNGDQDHAEWCAPENQGQSSRQIYTTTDGASDIAAEYAAALAVNYINFGNTEDLKYAKALYNFSVKNNKVCNEGTSGFYSTYDYYDDQAWAAGWLYLATKDSTYKNFLNTFMNSSGKGMSGQSGCQWGIYSTMSWNNVSMGAGILQAEITGSASDWAKVKTYLDGHGATSSSYYFENQWGSARYNAAQQLCALVASKYPASGANYYNWAKGQMGMLLGNNPINTCFVTGFSSNSAKYAHHRAASGYSSFDEMGKNVGYSSKGHTLIGALVGGPTSQSFAYNDSIQDYTANEVALDYNAALVGAAAGLYSKYKTGSVDSSIEGIDMKGNSNTDPTSETTEKTTTSTTTATTKNTSTTVSTSTSSQGGTVVKETVVNVNTQLNLNGSNMYEIALNKLIPENAIVNSFTFNLSSSGGSIGSVSYGAYASLVNNNPHGSNQLQNNSSATINGSSGSIVFEISDTYKGYIDRDGTLQFGYWWGNQQTVTLDSITCSYSLPGSESSTSTTTSPKNTSTSVSKSTSQSTSVSTGGEIDYTKLKNGDVNLDGSVDIQDLVSLCKYFSDVNAYALSATSMKNADVTHDGVLGSSDTVLLLKVVSGQLNESELNE